MGLHMARISLLIPPWMGASLLCAFEWKMSAVKLAICMLHLLEYLKWLKDNYSYLRVCCVHSSIFNTPRGVFELNPKTNIYTAQFSFNMCNGIHLQCLYFVDGRRFCFIFRSENVDMRIAYVFKRIYFKKSLCWRYLTHF